MNIYPDIKFLMCLLTLSAPEPEMGRELAPSPSKGEGWGEGKY